MLRLNLGCGRHPLPGWVNIDQVDHPGVDALWDLTVQPIPFDNDTVDEFLLSHVLEHIRETLPFMQELWRIAKPEARLTIRCPYGSSDDAWEDPTHVRPYFLQSFGYFSQPYYWRADYGYRGDWQTMQIELAIDGRIYGGVPKTQIFAAVLSQRNVVREMVAVLKAVKPARQPLRELQTTPSLDFRML